jgi:hypothetical protein
MTDQIDEAPTETTAPELVVGGRPVAKFSGSGGMNAAVWKRKADNGIEHYSVRLDRAFRTAEGQWETTPYLREGDLLRARKLLDQVDDWIEQDRAKFRAGQRQERGRE